MTTIYRTNRFDRARTRRWTSRLPRFHPFAKLIFMIFRAKVACAMTGEIDDDDVASMDACVGIEIRQRTEDPSTSGISIEKAADMFLRHTKVLGDIFLH